MDYLSFVFREIDLAKQILSKLGVGDVEAYEMHRETALTCVNGESVLKTIVSKIAEVNKKKDRVELVDKLIAQATDEGALSSMFEGWCAWY